VWGQTRPQNNEKGIEGCSRCEANLAGNRQGVKYQKISNNHSHKKSNEDELLMFQDLRKLKPFAITAGQHHNHFPDIALLPTSTINMSNFFKWLQMHKKQILK
jgi:hypothetical protein